MPDCLLCCTIPFLLRPLRYVLVQLTFVVAVCYLIYVVITFVQWLCHLDWLFIITLPLDSHYIIVWIQPYCIHCIIYYLIVLTVQPYDIIPYWLQYGLFIAYCYWILGWHYIVVIYSSYLQLLHYIYCLVLLVGYCGLLLPYLWLFTVTVTLRLHTFLIYCVWLLYVHTAFPHAYRSMTPHDLPTTLYVRCCSCCAFLLQPAPRCCCTLLLLYLVLALRCIAASCAVVCYVTLQPCLYIYYLFDCSYICYLFVVTFLTIFDWLPLI